MFSFTLPLCLILVLSDLCFSQEVLSQKESVKPFGRIGVGLKLSSLGAGAEAVVPLFSHSNLRTGFNYFAYGSDLDDGGVAYRGQLNLLSGQATYDWYPFRGGFHLGPTVLVYNGTNVQAKLQVPGGRDFTISKQTYRSDKSDPIHGSASMNFAKFAPGFLLGWGNMLSKRRHRFSVPFEFGFVYEGAPHVMLVMNGVGCDVGGRGCSSLAKDPTAVSSIHAEQVKIAREITFLRFYPVVSIGMGYSF